MNPTSTTTPSPTLIPPELVKTFTLPALPHLNNAQLIALAWHLLPPILIGVALALALTFARRLVLTRWNKPGPEAGWRFWLYHTLASIKPWFMWAVGLYVTVLLIEGTHRAIHLLFMAAFLLQLGFLMVGLLRHGSIHYLQVRHKGDSVRATVVAMLVMVGQMIIWAIIALMALNTVGVNVTAMLAGLGLGGVIIALGLKGMAEDLFSSMSIVFDRPFVLGDFIISGEFMGTVEYIGMKTTRLRSLSGEQIIIANHDLLASRIRNYGRMTERRVVFSIGVDYATPADKLEKIPGYIRDIVASHQQIRLDRSHFASFSATRLEFETVYYVTVPDYNTMMDIQQSINLHICRKFEAEGIAFGFPVQTVRAFVKDESGAEAGPSKKTGGK